MTSEREGATWGEVASAGGEAWVAVFQSPKGEVYRRRVWVAAGVGREGAEAAAWADRRERGVGVKGWRMVGLFRTGVGRPPGDVRRLNAAVGLAAVQGRAVAPPVQVGGRWVAGPAKPGGEQGG